MHAPITLSSKKYVLNNLFALNKLVSKYVVIALFSNMISVLLLVLSGFGFVLLYMHFMH